MFVDDREETVRLGDLPRTGKVLRAASPALRALLRLCASSPVDRDELAERTPAPAEEVDQAITALLEARVLVEEHDVEALTRDERSSRQALFFSMFQPAARAAEMTASLSERTVVILGVGGIGSSVATQLATAGVGTLRLVDRDHVEASNLHRQYLYSTADVGMPKVDTAARRLAERCPSLRVEARDRTLAGARDVTEVVAGADLVVATADSPQPDIRRWVNAGCLAAGVAFLPGGFTQHLGIAGPLVVPGESACLACLDEQLRAGNGGHELPAVENRDRRVPAFGPLCAIVAGLLAAEAIRFLTGVVPPALLNRMSYFDLLGMETSEQPVARSATCPACGAAS
ncbi:TOMM precursor leader peptide-binding protein [Nonomuraea sp. NPDC000554]|uniref:TOMM precursor leader peptide-binding protein n=1 Tax=Nonomuraea sp. NPDC000554 TaxID=3154259 RepID=UPI00332BE4CB